MAHLMNNTSKRYPCPNCGTPGNIIREGADPRMKCNNARCNFMYDGSASLAAVEANAIPDKPIELDDPIAEPLEPEVPVIRATTTAHSTKLPRTLSFVVVSKDRIDFEFTTKKGLKRVIFEWETSNRRYEVFELSPKKVSANVDIS